MMKGERSRLRITVLGLTAIFFVLTLRLSFLQLIRYPSLSSEARNQQIFKVKLEPRRGDILDSRGRAIALSLERWSIYAHPYKVKDKVKTALFLSTVLKMDKKICLEKLHSDVPFVWLKRKSERYEYEAIKKIGIDGIGFIEEARRYYPQGQLASNAVGFVGMDNHGLEGIEKRFDNLLGGVPGEYQVGRDARGREISSCVFRMTKPVEGISVYLTIDSVIQNIAEECLANAIDKANARGGTSLVLDPRTGEILAMASYPTIDPNNFSNYPQSYYRNHPVSFVFEPGSTFKVITAAAALDKKIFKTQDRIYCENGAIRVANYVIHDHEPHGWLTFSETVEKSSNIGLLKIGEKLGKDSFYEYIRAFGFGEKTGLEIPMEERGIVPTLRAWKPITVATMSFGQGIAVTPIQMASAYAAIANGGVVNKPYIVKRFIGHGVPLKKSFREEGRRVISLETSFRMREIMKKVVENGTGRLAKIEGVSIAGKTGTSQKINPEGGYSHEKYVASFIGFFPVEEPKILIGVFIDEPRGMYYGGVVAAPCFRDMANEIYAYLGLGQKEERIYMTSSPVNNIIRD